MNKVLNKKFAIFIIKYHLNIYLFILTLFMLFQLLFNLKNQYQLMMIFFMVQISEKLIRFDEY
jgi:hypothetical protein